MGHVPSFALIVWKKTRGHLFMRVYLFIYEKAIIHLSMGGLCLLLSAFAVPNLFLTLGTDLENSAALPKIIVGIAVPWTLSSYLHSNPLSAFI